MTEDDMIDAGLGDLPEEAAEYLRPYVVEVFRNLRSRGLAVESVKLREAAEDFVLKVETGRAFSKDSYQKFKRALAARED